MLQSCLICPQTKPSADMYLAICPRQHHICLVCLEDQVTTGFANITDTAVFPLRCCNADEPFLPMAGTFEVQPDGALERQNRYMHLAREDVRVHAKGKSLA
jgi:hypothetical protein